MIYILSWIATGAAENPQLFHPYCSQHPRPGAALLLLVLFVRALVPEGFMPTQGALIELCTEHGLQRMLVDAETGEILGQEETGSSPTCPWSLMLPTLAPPALPAGSFVVLATHDPAQRSTGPRVAPVGPVLPPARAPPNLV